MLLKVFTFYNYGKDSQKKEILCGDFIYTFSPHPLWNYLGRSTSIININLLEVRTRGVTNIVTLFYGRKSTVTKRPEN